MFSFLLIVQALIAISLVGTILMQRSEGGGLGVGGSSSGFMTARGAADFLTRSTAVLGAMFIVLSIVMAAIAGATRQPTKIDTSLAKSTMPLGGPQQKQPVPGQPGQAPANQQQQQKTPAAPQQNPATPQVPLAQ